MVYYDAPPEQSEGHEGSKRKVHALYDFEGEPNTSELSIRCGEVLTLIRTDVGEGWWEGLNSQGQSGLFPQAYVEEYKSDEDDEGPPAMAPPPLPADYGNTVHGSNAGSSKVDAVNTNGPWNVDPWSGSDDWNQLGSQHHQPADDEWGGAQTGASMNNADFGATQVNKIMDDDFTRDPSAHNDFPSCANTNQAYDQDDWDSDFDDQPEPSSSLGIQSSQAGPSGLSGSTSGLANLAKGDSKKQVSAAGRTSFSRFSSFVKTGTENYLLGKLSVNVVEADMLQVVDNGDGTFSWLNAQPSYSCEIASPKKESKLSGLKSFIAYQITPSFNQIQVPRRYKHFDWLHERLSKKFIFIPIPPLPDKQIQGRYEEEFIERRMYQLQSFVDRVCQHPVLSQCEVWQHFLTCTDEKRWKSGKRKAEKDALIAAAHFKAVKTPTKSLDLTLMEKEIGAFSTFTTQMDASVKNMLKTCADQTQKFQNHFKREYQTIGKAFHQMGSAMALGGTTYSPNLTNAIGCTGEAYEEVGKLFEEQPRYDWDRLGDVMHDYRGMLATWPSILQVYSGALSKCRDVEKLAKDGKVGQSELSDLLSKTDTLSYTFLAEMNTFHSQRVLDMKKSHQTFLQEQIKFYQKIVEKLQDALSAYDKCA